MYFEMAMYEATTQASILLHVCPFEIVFSCSFSSCSGVPLAGIPLRGVSRRVWEFRLRMETTDVLLVRLPGT